MPRLQARTLLGHIRQLVGARPDDRTDCELLRSFLGRREESAFAMLLQRHAPLVWSVCRRALGQEQDAEDAFQAAFLVLAQKAASIRNTETVGGWLHGVACRMAMNAKRSRMRRQRHEQRAALVEHDRETMPQQSEAALREMQVLLDEEVDRLPMKYRAPFVLCCLEGRSRAEAARELGWKEGTVSSRLAQARERLRQRLVRRGITLSAALTAGVLWSQSASAYTPAALIKPTLKAALFIAAGGSASQVVAPSIAALVVRGTKSMATAKVKIASALLLATSLVVGIGWAVGQRLDEKPEPVSQQRKADEHKANTDLDGDPLPEGAVLRLGTLERRAVGAKLAMTADGKSIIGVRGGRYIHVWDAANGKLREKRELPGGEPWNFWLSAEGRWLARGTRSDFTVWDLQTYKQLHTFTIPCNHRVTFSADGKTVAAAGQAEDKISFHAWDLTSGKEIFAKDVPLRRGASDQLAFTPDGKHLLGSVSSTDEGMQCWDLASGEQVWQNKKSVHGAMAFTADGKLLLPSPEMFMVDLATGKPVSVEKKPPVRWDTLMMSLTPDGRTLLLSTADGVIVWDMGEGKELRVLKGAGEELVVAPDGKTIITNNGALQRWDLATGRPLYADNFEQGHIGDVTALAFSADGKRLASASADGSVRLWDTTTGKPLHVWRGHEAHRPVLDSHWFNAGVTALDISPDGRWVLSAGSEGQLRVHDASTGKEVLAIPLAKGNAGEDKQRVFHLRISPSGNRAVALFGADGFPQAVAQKHTYKLATWDLSNGRQVGWHSVEVQPPRSSAFSAGGRTLLSGETLIDVASGQETARLEGGFYRGAPDNGRAFSWDGALVAGQFTEQIQNGDMTLVNPAGTHIWEAATGKTVARLETTLWTAQLAFHPNNRYVAINNLWTGIQVWDALTGKPLVTRPMPEQVRSAATDSYAGCLAFAPNGRRLATGHPDGTILLWDMPPPQSPPQPLAAKELGTLWTDLGDADAAKAWRVIWRLNDGSAVPVLREHLKPVLPLPAEKVSPLIADLDNESFEKRQEAVKQLKALGAGAAPALRQALDGTPTAETKRRLQEVLAAHKSLSAEAVRELRAVIALERIGNREARDTLAELAKGVPEAKLTRKAKAALERLAKRSR
jgi:RNA polymerase sigma factor (sigma-70 family)